MRILHILDHSIPLHSGYSFRTLSILKQQRQLGWETFHITSAKHKGARHLVEDIDGFLFYRSEEPNAVINHVPVLNQWGVVKTLLKRLDEIVEKLNPDILHAHSPALNGLAALQISKRYNIPLVYECRAFWEDAAVDHGSTTENSIRYRMTRMLESHVFKHADAITTICEGLRQEIIQRGFAPEKITVIPNAVNIDQFTFKRVNNEQLKAKLGIKNEAVIGFIGSFYAYEGLPLLLEALPMMIEKNQQIKILLVGGGTQEQIIKQKVKDLAISEHVIFTGRVPHEQIQGYYHLIDITVYPRLSMRLTELVTPLKPLEAMAQGCLVVASDVGGHKELIRDEETGSLFASGSSQALASAVLNLLANKQQWDERREHARKFVEQERNWKKSVARYQKIYKRLIDAESCQSIDCGN